MTLCAAGSVHRVRPRGRANVAMPCIPGRLARDAPGRPARDGAPGGASERGYAVHPRATMPCIPFPTRHRLTPSLPGLLLLLAAGPWAAHGLDMGHVGGLAARRAGTHVPASPGAPLRQLATQFGGLRLRGGQDEAGGGTQGEAEGGGGETDGQYGVQGRPDGVPEHQAGAQDVRPEVGAGAEHGGEQHADAAPEQVPAGGADGGEGGEAGGTDGDAGGSDGGEGDHTGDRAPPLSQHQSDVGTSNQDAAPSQEEGQSAPEPPVPPPPPPPSPPSDAGAGLAADPASDHLGPIIEFVAGKAIWSLVGFAAGWMVASYGVTYHRISALDDTDEEEEFVNAVLSLNLPYP